jgi:hypothetical protein
MFLIHEPADGPAERYDLDEMAAAEAEAVERVTGMKWGEVEQALQQQSPTALRAVLWTWRKREQPTLRYGDFDVPGWRKRLKVRLAADEVADLVEAVNKQYPTDDPDHAQALRELEQLADDPKDVQRAVEGTAPKGAPSRVVSRRSASATGG